MTMRAHQNGLTVVELMITIAIAAIILSWGVPSFQKMMAKHRLRSAAEEVVNQLQFARLQSIKSNRDVRVQFDTDNGTNWCYGLDDDLSNTCDCSSATDKDYCTIEDPNGDASDGPRDPRIVESSNYSGVSVTQVTFSNDDTEFDTRRGTVDSAGKVELKADDDMSMEVVVSTIGRVRICSDNIAGYPGC